MKKVKVSSGMSQGHVSGKAHISTPSLALFLSYNLRPCFESSGLWSLILQSYLEGYKTSQRSPRSPILLSRWSANHLTLHSHT